MPRAYWPYCTDALGKLALAEQIAFGNAEFGHPAAGGRVTARDRELAGRDFIDVDIEHDAIRRRARLVGDLDGLEIVEVLQAPFGAVDERAVVCVALADVEFAADHVVAGAGVAADIDPLDVDARAVFHGENDADGMGRQIAVAARTDHGKRIAAAGHFDRQVLDRLFDGFGIVHVAGASLETAVKRSRIDHRDARLNIDLAEPVAPALVDGEGDDEALLLRIVDRHRRNHAHVRIAVLEIEAADQVAVGFDAVGIIDVGRLEECEQRNHVVSDVLISSLSRWSP